MSSRSNVETAASTAWQAAGKFGHVEGDGHRAIAKPGGESLLLAHIASGGDEIVS
jgi:hypothetical protein